MHVSHSDRSLHHGHEVRLMTTLNADMTSLVHMLNLTFHVNVVLCSIFQ